MSQTVVDHLESVEIEEEDTEKMIREPPATMKIDTQPFGEPRAIGEAGQ